MLSQSADTFRESFKYNFGHIETVRRALNGHVVRANVLESTEFIKIKTAINVMMKLSQSTQIMYAQAFEPFNDHRLFDCK